MVARARHMMALDYHARMSLEDLARALGVSERTLSRKFTAAMGVTPFAYGRGLKLEVAARMLRTSILRVDQIALRVGYQDIRFFRAAFRAQFAVSPEKYRRNTTKPAQA